MHLSDLVIITTDPNPDFNFADFEQECRKMFLANQYTQKFYDSLKNGTLEPGFITELGDVLAECNVEPTEWVEAVEDNVSYVLLNGIAYEV
jgi:hypothetical protein